MSDTLFPCRLTTAYCHPIDRDINRSRQTLELLHYADISVAGILNLSIHEGWCMKSGVINGLVLAILAGILVLTSCNDELECGEGTITQGSLCLPLCVAGQRWDHEANDCVSVCADGTLFNDDTGECEPEVSCGPGTHRRENECVPDSLVECGIGTTYDVELGECVPDCVEGTHRDEETGACMPNSAACIRGPQ